MKKTTTIIRFAALVMAMGLALTLTACPPDPDPTHEHKWGEWQHNATQHWKECTANDGAEYGRANHTGDPCSVCGYDSTNPDPCECNGNAEDCDCDNCDCETCETPASNEPTISSFGAAPASITVPAENTVQLTCTATSKDGSAVKSVKWTVEDKPELANPTIENAETAAATVNDMEVAGTYKFKLVVTGNNDATKTEYVTVSAGLYYEVGFVTLGTFPGATTLNFSPSATLPTGVTYIITNNKTSKTWNNTGTVSASDFVDVNDDVTFTQTFYLNGAEITNAESKRTVKLVVDTFIGVTDFSFISDTGSVTLKWPADMSLPITHAITVPAIAFPSTGSQTLNFVPSISGWNADFPASGLTYTLTSDLIADLTSYNGVIPASIYEDMAMPVFTQVFYYSGQEVGQRSVTGVVSGNTFTYIYDASWQELDSIPELTLLLRKNAGVVTKTVTAEIRIAAVPFVAGTQQKFFVDSNYYSLVVTNGTNADFADENIALITYIVEDETADPKIVWQSSNGAVTVSSIDYPNGLRTFTQTFTYKDKTVSRSVRLGVNTSQFSQMRGMEGNAQITEIPAVKINLEKEITE